MGGLPSRALVGAVLEANLSEKLQQAATALRSGRFVLLYDADGREEETDLVIPSGAVTPAHIRTLRTEAGGLICTTIPAEFHLRLGLPYLSDVLHQASAANPLLERLATGEVPYEEQGSKPSFGLSINHRKTFTGVTDNDRTLTITRLASLVGDFGHRSVEWSRNQFAEEFKSPGHVFLLNAHPKLLDGRRGHTELSTGLVQLAGLPASATICEMMNGPSGRALPKADAIKYAAQHDLVFLEGAEVVRAWQQRPRARSA